jgi:tetratricopeptide (TPR) repeat protein
MNGNLSHVSPARRATSTATELPEDLLKKAMGSRSPAARARWAQRGLASRAPIDRTTHALLLRQLYMAYYETRRFEDAREVASQALELDVVRDLFHEDMARVAIALGDVEDAVSHLRLAARRGPPSRRPFHLWTLGSVLFFQHRYAEASTVLARAVRWGTTDKPLFRAHLALVRMAAGERVEGLQATIDDLAAAPCGRGYGRFVLGHLAYATGAWDSARKFLEAFVRRTETAGTARILALDAELRMARATLAKIASN